MHPALSIIVFTAASGTGYGLLFLLALGALAGLLPADRGFGLAATITSLGLVTGGLLSSTLHLGHPERAWRALSQWRSSWLSREGVAALATYPVALAFGAGWVVYGDTGGWWSLAALLAAAGAAATVGATAMIYASLKPIRHWRNTWTVAVYYGMALAGGAVVLVALATPFGHRGLGLNILAIAALTAAWAAKVGYWRHVDAAPPLSSPESATGLARLGHVRPLFSPHAQENYLLKEMGFRIARKHATKLRRWAVISGLAVPAVALASAALLAGALGAVLAVLAVPSALLGILIERWLFFAEARHTVMLYYEGAE